MKENHAKYIEFVVDELVKKTKHNKTTLETIAKKQFNITDQNQVKELTELAIVIRARFLANQIGTSIKQRYFSIVELYKSQVNLSHRTSQSMLLQQYSTPAPIGYMAGIYVGLNYLGQQNKTAFEPSAGNGLLTIAADEPRQFVVNEIDDFRANNLKQLGFNKVTQHNAEQPIQPTNLFDAVITNPPFGKASSPLVIQPYTFTALDHVMAINALNVMKNNGKAAIIIGGHTVWDTEGRIQAGKNRTFLSYLYKNYNVEDVLLIDGHKLYSRQGTAFNTRLILINGRKAKPEGYAPLFNPITDKVIDTFEELFNRVSIHFKVNLETKTPTENIKNIEVSKIYHDAAHKPFIVLEKFFMENLPFYNIAYPTGKSISLSEPALIKHAIYKFDTVKPSYREKLLSRLKKYPSLINKNFELEAEALALELELLDLDSIEKLGGPYEDGISELAKNIADFISKTNYHTNNPSHSKTNFGRSSYIYVYKSSSVEDSSNPIKIRISDHSVSNIDRIFNEIHIPFPFYKKNEPFNEKDFAWLVQELDFRFYRSKYFIDKEIYDDYIVKMEVSEKDLKDSDKVISTRLSSGRRGPRRTIYNIERTNKRTLIAYLDTRTGKVFKSFLK